MALDSRPQRFIIIGENIHATRIVLRKGNRVKVLDDGTEGVRFRDTAGKTRYLAVPPRFRETQAFQQGQIKHVMIAVQKGISSDSAEQEEGTEYLRAEARRQIEAGASFLDLNVDEVSTRLDVQQAAMRWLVGTIQEISPIPLSIDSSNTEILAEGLRTCDCCAGRPMINSATLERIETLDLARKFDAEIIATGAGRAGMPENTEQRVANVEELVGQARARGIALADIHVDPLVFPISVDSNHGRHYLDAVRTVRQTYGPEIHLTGGLSNVSFGIPNRKLVNETFIALAIDAGIDGAIMDPVQNRIDAVRSIDRTSEPYQLAAAMLLGEDEFCMNYLMAFRKGRLGS
ncbi:MAG: dihydropteroate synthase [Chloroflexi bacterium]|nr:dihydropteroate synthase [Chloroflexota bacterium]